jgi:hypothetical protein
MTTRNDKGQFAKEATTIDFVAYLLACVIIIGLLVLITKTPYLFN